MRQSIYKYILVFLMFMVILVVPHPSLSDIFVAVCRFYRRQICIAR